MFFLPSKWLLLTLLHYCNYLTISSILLLYLRNKISNYANIESNELWKHKFPQHSFKNNATIIKGVKKMFSKYTPRGTKNQSVGLKPPPAR